MRPQQRRARSVLLAGVANEQTTPEDFIFVFVFRSILFGTQLYASSVEVAATNR